MRTFIMVSVILLNAIIQRAIVVNVIKLLSVVMLTFIMVSVILLNAIKALCNF